MLKPLRHLAFIFALYGLSACSLMSPPDNLDTRQAKVSAQGVYEVAMRPLAPQVAVNQIHSWEIRVTSPAGVPVTHATLTFDGGMPQHGHGFPTQPRVTEELGDGRYRLDGVKFSMTGWWEMTVKIQAQQGADKVTFNTVLDGNGIVADRTAVR